MPLMKETKLGSMSHDAIVLDLGDLRRQADELMARARREADAIIREAQAKAQQLIDEAQGIGHAQGLEAGTAQGLEQGRAAGHAQALESMKQQLEKLQQAWSGAAEQVESQRRQHRLDARQDVLELALVIAKKVVKRMPEVQPGLVMDELAAVIEHIARPGDLTVRIHPTDRALVQEALPVLAAQFDQMQHVKLVDDPAISPGGCIVNYGRGQIDATLEMQIERIVTTLLPGMLAPVTSNTEPAA